MGLRAEGTGGFRLRGGGGSASGVRGGEGGLRGADGREGADTLLPVSWEMRMAWSQRSRAMSAYMRLYVDSASAFSKIWGRGDRRDRGGIVQAQGSSGAGGARMRGSVGPGGPEGGEGGEER